MSTERLSPVEPVTLPPVEPILIVEGLLHIMAKLPAVERLVVEISRELGQVLRESSYRDDLKGFVYRSHVARSTVLRIRDHPEEKRAELDTLIKWLSACDMTLTEFFARLERHGGRLGDNPIAGVIAGRLPVVAGVSTVRQLNQMDAQLSHPTETGAYDSSTSTSATIQDLTLRIARLHAALEIALLRLGKSDLAQPLQTDTRVVPDPPQRRVSDRRTRRKSLKK